MKELFKKHTVLFHVLIICLISMTVIFSITRTKYIFGAYGDWYNQSVTFLQYFRNLFYKTGNLFPDLALHIGGGQNIYYFAYYGLFSPYLFLFCLMPYLSAGNFIIFTSILNLIISSILLYFFFRKNLFSGNVSLLGALLLLVSTSFVYFNFKFIMFVQYMPFLILGLFGTKKYLDEGKSLLLIISIVLIITTSYYFSIPSIICLCLYALYYYIKINNSVNLKIVFKEGIRYVLRIFLGIIIASFLLLPVIFTILNGREIGGSIFSHDLISKIMLSYLMYHVNGLGLSSIVWFSLMINIFFFKKENKILSILLFLITGVPLINLLLNGTLYLNGKILVPFLPLFILLILNVISNIHQLKYKKIFLCFIITIILGLILINFLKFVYLCVFLLDLLITYIIIILYKRQKRIGYLFLVVILIFVITMYYIDNKSTTMLKRDYYSYLELIDIDFDEYINKDALNMYRTEFNKNDFNFNYSDASSLFVPTIYSSISNSIYKKIFNDTFNNNYISSNKLAMISHNNLFWERFMGVRYLLTDMEEPYGYMFVDKYNAFNLYENKNVYSIGFASSNLLSYDEYNKLSFIEKLMAYQENIIVDNKSNNSTLNFNYEKLDLDYEIKFQERVNIDYKDSHYIINSLSYGKLNLLLNGSIKNKVLVIRFIINNDVNCNYNKINNGNLSIIINDVKNTLSCKNNNYYNNNKTFDYVISSNSDISELDIEFYEGFYDISDIEVYVIDNSFFDRNNTIPLNINFDRTKGDDIYGSIDVKESGYFIFTIPYDKGYTAYLDGKEVEIEKVNNGFIGFNIDKGYHNIHLTFEAPYAKLGRIISLFGIFMLIILGIYEKKKNGVK